MDAVQTPHQATRGIPQDKVSNLEVLERVKTASIEAMILKAQLCWTSLSHVIRMDETRIPGQLLQEEIANEAAHACLRYKDLVKANLQHAKIQPKEIEAAASDIVRWHALSKIACKSFQEHRYQRFQEKREKRQSAAEAAPLQNTDRFSMPEVSKSACFRIGLHSHLRAHDKKE